jgi:radical SAM-linked protein
MQRLRVSFSRGEELKFLSHLDLMRLWERAFRRAGMELAYSQGFTPHPRISLAAPLSVGITSYAELMDVYVSRWIAPQSFVSQVDPQLPQGLTITDIKSAGLTEPSLQSQVRFAEYKVEIETALQAENIESAIASLLSAKEIPWQHQRDTGIRNYDLRPLIDNVLLIELQGSRCTMIMNLACSSNGAGRPEQVIKALGFLQRPVSMQRTRLILS